MRYVSRMAVLGFCSVVPGVLFAQGGQTLSITNYQFVSSQQVTTTLSNVTYRADIVNTGNPEATVLANATSLNPSSFTMVSSQDTLSFAPVPANTPVTSSNTFTMRVNRTVPFDFANLQWTFQTTPLPPVANAGANQTARVGDTVTLNGSGSTNPSGVGTLTYSWAFTYRPGGSAHLNNPTGVMPTFTVDVSGNFIIALTVSNGIASSTSSVTVSTVSSPPVANAGPNQTVAVGSRVVLDGSHSSDVDGKPLTYKWNLVGLPPGSLAALTGADTPSPKFTADKAGTYQVRLIVNDGSSDSLPAFVTITTQNSIPVANAGPNQVVTVGALVHLNGAGSTDVDGDPLTFRWSLPTVPAGSAAVPSPATDPMPTFTVDKPGTYVAQLIVNDGQADSTPSTVTITTNALLPPTANAGASQTVVHGTTVTLNGFGSDPQGLPITYHWSLIALPPNSLAAPSSKTIASPTFVADLPGTYTAQLIVNNSFLNSAPTTVNITTTNTPPVANAGLKQNVTAGTTVQLDGTGSSDADNDPLTYSWSITTRPNGSSAIIPASSIAQPTFVPDLAGTYIVQLIVSDGFVNSQPTTVTITAVSSFRFSLTPNPLNLTTAANGIVRVTAPFATGPNGQDVQLQSFDTNVVTVPATATIPAGGTFVDVAVTPDHAGGTTILAFCQVCSYQPGTTTVNVAAATITLTLDSGNVAFGSQTNGTISLSAAAPAGGVIVALTSAPPGPVQISPANVSISAGGTTGTFTVKGLTVGSATITGSASRYTSGTANVTVGQAGTILLPANVTVAPGQSLPFPVSLASAAPANGVTITLIGSDPNTVTVTPSVFIDSGLTTPAVGAQITGVSLGPATITASAQGFTGSTANVSVVAALTILTTSLPNGTVGAPYSQTLRATGGFGAYTWQLTAGALPAGLTLNASTGQITGTPSAPVTGTPLSFKVTDSGSPAQTATVNSTLTIAPVTLTITTLSLPNGAVGAAYSQTLAATGGATPYHWQVTFGTLPNGLTLNASTGVISGTPTAPVSATPLTFQVTDSGSPTQTATAGFNLTIAPSTLTITTLSLANGAVGVAYSNSLAATGGTGTYTWTVTSGTLPAGLTLNASSGLIGGTPTAVVSSTPLSFKVTDSGSPAQTATVNLTLTITPAPLTITTSSLPNGVVGAVYSQTLAATGGTGVYSWQLTSGSLPNGLTLNAISGQISGTPTATVTATPLTFKVTDSGSPAQTATTNLTLTVTTSSLNITTTSLPDGQVGVVYAQLLAASGGAGPYTWQVTSGTLPAGLSLNASTGLVGGTPGAVASATPLSFKVTDSASPAQTATVNLTLTIAPSQLKIVNTSLLNGQVGVAYSQTLAATGGTGAYSWQLTNGALPNGLTLNATSGLISGTPTAAANATPLTFKVTDSGSPAQTATATIPLTIVAPLLTITTASLPTAVVNVPYAVTLQASGGNTPYTWAITFGRLPSGMTFDPSSGLISGTMAFTGGSLMTFKVTDSSSPAQTASVVLPLTVTTSGLIVSTTALLSGQLNQAYTQAPCSDVNHPEQQLYCLSASGGILPYGWQVVFGALPAGLTMDSTTGVISGTPTEVVTNRKVVFQVSDSGGQSTFATLFLSIASGPLTITTTSLPGDVVGTAYSQTLASTGGVPTTSWKVIAGTLPDGLSLNAATGEISGTPTTPINATPLTFQATDSAVPVHKVTVDLTLSIASGPLTITTTSLPNGSMGTAYSQTLTATGGTGAHTWQLTSGALPNGLSLNASTGLIGGTPTNLVNATPLTFKATDSGSPAETASVNLTLTITATPLSITTASLPNGTVNTAYSQTLAATGGTGTYTWQLTSGTLLAGLTFNTSTGLISGTPTTAVTATPLSFKVTDSGSPVQTATANLSLTISAPALTITTTSLPSATVGVPYSFTLMATGGVLPYTWSVASGRLPGGFTLDPSTGVISGTQQFEDSAAITIKVTDSSSPVQTATVPLILPILSGTLAISTKSLADGKVGVAYSQTLTVTGGATPYTWILTSGSLPGGLTLSAATGLISGTPLAPVTNNRVTVQVKDSSSPQQTASTAFQITITPTALTITTTSLPNGAVGTAYSQTLAATGGTGPYTWQLTSGTLPANLTLNASSGLISGTPSVPVTAAPLTFMVTDSSSPAQTASVNLTLTITSATLTITTTSLPNGQVGVAYSQTLAASGGTGTLTWQLTAGTLPTGMTLNASTGLISGTPAAPVTATPLTFKVTDSGSPAQTATANLALTIAPATLTITTASLANGVVNTGYTQTLAASGGTGAYTWQLTAGTLPAGLALNASTGLISGTPTIPVTATPLTFKVTDSGSPTQTATANLTLTITPATLTITTASLSTGVAGVAYSQPLAATGGTGAYTWQLTAGTLPAGLSLNASTGLISGTPNTPVTATTLTFRVTDSGSPAQTANASFTLTIAPPVLTITTTSLPNGVVGTAYSQTLQAAGGITPYTWQLTAGTLPTGLTLNASTGVVSGMPSVAVTSTPLTFKVTDSASTPQVATANLTLTIAPPPLTITTASLTSGQVAVGYSQTLAATGGTGAYSWQLIAGTLPQGLALNASTGLIGGTPTTAVAATPLTFKVTDSGSPAQTATANFTLTIAPATLAITTASLAPGQVNVAYSLTLAATGGTGTYTWQSTGGALPAGLTLNAATGMISGTPTTPVTATPLTFKVTDSGSPVQTASANFTLTIAPAPLTITTASLPNGQVGVAYSQTLAATGGTGAYTWQLTAGTLPTGLTLNASTGLISGTPTLPVTATTLGFKVTDSGSPAQTANASFTVTIAPAPLTITTASLPNGQAGVAYSQTLAATGGTGAYTWQLTAGTLPTGLTLNAASGLISGTPTLPVTATPLTFKVTDSGSSAQNTSATFNLTIAPAPLTITTASLPNGQAGVAYSQTLAATGGTGAYAWQLTAGTLPTGLSLNASSGLISGTPTIPVTAASLTFKVTDSGSPAQTATATLTLTIAPAPLTITTASLPNGTVGVVYSQTLAATGGTGAYTWQLTAGALPAGLALTASSGLITGTPSTVISATPLTFKVTDSGSPAQNASVSLTLTIAPPPLTITTSSLVNGAVGSPYSVTLAATGGTGSYSWQLISGTLPNGLVLHAATGQISGNPTAPASKTPLGFKVTDSGTPAQTATTILTLTISPLTLTITTTSPLPNGVTAVAYSATVTAIGGTAPYTWSATGLPSGLIINSSGQIVGSPSALGTSSVIVTVTDSSSPTPSTAQATLSLTIIRLLIIQTSSLPDATAGVPYGATASAIGGTAPYTWFANNLPAGLLMSTSGQISGTTTAGSAAVTVTVADSGSPTQQTASVVLNLNVIGGASGTFTVSSISVGKNLQGLVYVSIPQVAPDSGVPLTLTSGDASKLIMTGQNGATSQITTSIPGGQKSIGVFVQALSDTGTVTLTANATNFFGTGTITLTPSGFILSGGGPGGSFTANQGSATQLTVSSARLDASNNFAELQPIRTGFSTTVPLTNTSPSVGTLAPTSVTFNGGDSSNTTIFTAANTGSTSQASATLTAGVPAGFSLPAANANSVTAFITGAGILPCNTTVGKSLEAVCQITLNGTASNLLNVTVTSNNPTKLLLSNTPDGAGQTQITVTVATGHSLSAPFYVFGLDSTGTPTYTATATGFGTTTGTVTLAPSGFIISGPNLGFDFTTNTASPVTIAVYSALLTPTGDFSAGQNVAGGLSFNVNMTATDIAPAAGVGSLNPSQVTIAGGVGSAFSTFQPLSVGSTTLAVVQPSGFTVPNQYSSVKATVNQPGMNLFWSGTLGYHLQEGASLLLGAQAPSGGVQVTITSNNPSQLLVSADPTVAGSDHITFNIDAGLRNKTFYFYGLASSGSPSFTITAAGYNSFTATEVLAPSAVLIAYGPQFLNQVTTNVSSGNLTLNVYTAQLDPSTLGFVQFEAVAGGFPTQVQLGDSNAAAGTISPQSVTFNGNDSSKNVVFTPKVPGGVTDISVAAPALPNFQVLSGFEFVHVTVNNQ
jgi:hypothetical protein